MLTEEEKIIEAYADACAKEVGFFQHPLNFTPKMKEDMLASLQRERISRHALAMAVAHDATRYRERRNHESIPPTEITKLWMQAMFAAKPPEGEPLVVLDVVMHFARLLESYCER